MNRPHHCQACKRKMNSDNLICAHCADYFEQSKNKRPFWVDANEILIMIIVLLTLSIGGSIIIWTFDIFR
jgi:predicted nucleic acid-binding Zn ribbon protein